MVIKFRAAARGFTLVELMMTLLILAVMVNAAMPSFQDELEKARLSEIVMQLDALRTALNSDYDLGDTDFFTQRTAYSIGVPQPQLNRIGFSQTIEYPNLTFVLGSRNGQTGHFSAGTNNLYVSVFARGDAGKRSLANLGSLLPEHQWAWSHPGSSLVILMAEQR